MKKFWKSLALLLCLLAGFGFVVTGCSNGDDGGNQQEKATNVTTHLVKFNADSTEWAAEKMVIKGSASSGGKEGYLVLNHRINIASEDVTIEADVVFSSLSGHVGLGFISVDGAERKGYSMLTGQNIKNVSATLGGGGNGLTPSVNWAIGTTYHFKAAYTAANNTEKGSSNCIVYTVYDASGAELGTNTTPLYYSANDIVYPALGGTTAENASYSNIKMSVGGVSYTFNGLDGQTALAALATSVSSLRLLLNKEGTFTYTCLADGATVPVSLEYDASILEVKDDGKGTVTVKGIAPTTSTTIKVINTKATYIAAIITVVVEDFSANDAYGALTTVYPANGATAAYEDGELRITFDSAPTLSATGSISIYDTDGNWVDTIKASDETLTVPSGKNKAQNKINVKDQLIRVEGNSVYFTPHYGLFEAGKTYFVAIPKSVITAKLNTKDFDGLALNKDNPSWKFTVRAEHTASPTMTVDGSESSTADFRTIHGALLAIGASEGDYTINIAPGTYRELVHFNQKANITLAGTGANARGTDTIIQWTNLNKWNGSMDTRSVVYFGDETGNVVIKNLTIRNTTDRSKVGTADTQAEALYYKAANKLAVYNATLKSYQDTICTKGASWFYDCYIEGDTDFIWGYSDVALFEKCELVCLRDAAKSSNADILFVSRCGTKSKAKLGKGFVLLNSTVKVNDGVEAFLGRNAGSGDFYDQIAVVNTAFTKEGSGVVSTDLWSDAKTYDYIDGKEDKVGLKIYNLTGDIDVSKKIDHIGTISAADYALEFNGRRAILNRVYVKEDNTYASGSKWDETYLTALETAANAVADESKGNIYGGEASKSWMVETAADGTFTDGDLNVIVSGTNANGHGAEVKATGTSSVTITIPKGSYILVAGTCIYGAAAKPYTLACSNADFKYEFIGTHTYSTEDCYNPGSSRTDLYGDIFIVKSESTMAISLNSDGVKEYLPFIKLVKEPKYFVGTADNGTFTDDEMSVVISSGTANGHGVEVKSSGATSVKVSLPAGSYIFVAGTCIYGKADEAGTVNNYTLTCANTDFTQEYVGTHAYQSEDCYNPGSSRTDLFGDYYYIKSASAMEITVQSKSVKEYLPFIGAIK